MTKYYTYIARCSDGTLYTGYTCDLKKRQEVHNLGKGARYTRARLPIEIIYSEEHPHKIQAMQREYAIKKLSRQQKECLINPPPAANAENSA
jgi:putative endonuclease